MGVLLVETEIKLPVCCERTATCKNRAVCSFSRFVEVQRGLGTNQIRVSKEELLKLYPLRKKALTKPKPVAKLYSLEPKDCYTIGEISKKFHLEDSTVYLHIRKYSIPTRQIGNFVYVPKKEIDNLYKGMKQ